MAEYIEREAASAVIKRLKSPTRSPAQNELIRMAQVGVDRIPASDVAPVRHGQWIVKGYVCGETEYQCSECKETEWRTSASRLKYCPFCGAKMDGGAD